LAAGDRFSPSSPHCPISAIKPKNPYTRKSLGHLPDTLTNSIMEEIRNHLNKFIPQNDEDWDFFSTKLFPGTFPKKSILEKGKTENYLSWVEEGILRLYIPRLENDLTFGFVFPGGFVSAYDSFLTQSPCTYQVQALTDCRLWRISHYDLQQVYKHTQVGNEIGRRNAEQLFLIKSERELSLLDKTAEERYLDIFSRRPELIRQIPQKYIASYIGVTPQALSRIRRRIR
jgi:CRP-like cAMP-binding protein